jgi:hypothetical protein
MHRTLSRDTVPGHVSHRRLIASSANVKAAAQLGGMPRLSLPEI